MAGGVDYRNTSPHRHKERIRDSWQLVKLNYLILGSSLSKEGKKEDSKGLEGRSFAND